MRKQLLKLSIYLGTRRCLKNGRLRRFSLNRVLNFSSNLVFSLIVVALMATGVRAVYHLPDSLSLEAKIRAGEAIPDSEVRPVAEATAVRKAALIEVARLGTSNQVRHYAERFGIDTKLSQLIYDISRDEDVEPELIYRIIWAESRFKPDCVGDIGEIGLMQVRYGTALTVDPGATRKKLFDPAYNIRIGIKHLKDHLHYFRGNMQLALLAYNRGRGRVNELLQLGINPSNGYARKVLESNL